MDKMPGVQPLPYKSRQRTFGLLFFLFITSLPFLYLYATGYRFDLDMPTNFVSTGGLYVAAERTGAEIYIDGELVRETRVFRKAFYAQNLDPGTHRVYVQKNDHHTWVKELPVSAHLVTEAQAFNLPIVPQVRVISEWLSATSSAIVRTPLLLASTTNEILATSTKATSTFTHNTEYINLIKFFATSTATTTIQKHTVVERIDELLTASSTATTTGSLATTTKEYGGVRLFEDGDELYAQWVGPFEEMPYYYCAEDFPRYSTSTATTSDLIAEVSTVSEDVSLEAGARASDLIHPVQTVPKDAVCKPTIPIDRKGQAISSFDYYPGSIDFVVIALEDGVYVVEVDDRSWQNVQPLIMGKDLHMHVENGSIYVYDGNLIYQIIQENS